MVPARGACGSLLLRSVLPLVCAIALLAALPSAQVAHAATIVVTSTNDSGPGSLRQAISDAAPGDVISFAVTGTITLTSGELVIQKDLTINGPGASSLGISGNNSSRVFHVGQIDPIVTATISGVTVKDGAATGSEGGAGIWDYYGTLTLDSVVVGNNHVPGTSDDDVGGGIWNQQGTLTVNGSTISGNTADRGGGISNAGASTMTVENSTISGNTAGAGGGVLNYGNLSVSSTTVSSNNSTWDNGGGILNETGATLKNTIIADSPMGGNCNGVSITSAGHNLSSDATCNFGGPGDLNSADPLLGPLADNGGATLTRALLAGSPAIDAGSSDCPPPATDERGIARPQGLACDIGAFELQPGKQVKWGDVHCDGTVDAVDSLGDLRHLAQLPPLPHSSDCPEIGAMVEVSGFSPHLWGDIDCDGDVNSIDALKILRFVAHLPVEPAASCPVLGDTVSIVIG